MVLKSGFYMKALVLIHIGGEYLAPVKRTFPDFAEEYLDKLANKIEGSVEKGCFN